MCKATLLFAVLLAASAILAEAAGAPNSVQVGSFTLGGTDTNGTVFTWTLDASKLTSQPICFGAITLNVDGVSQTYLRANGFNPCTLPLVASPSPNHFLVQGCDANTAGCWSTSQNWPLPSCFNGCTSISVQLLSTDGKKFSFTLLSGKKFTTFGVNTSSMSPQPGQLYLTPGQSVPLVLYSDPPRK
jgi:hypothetical protein